MVLFTVVVLIVQIALLIFQLVMFWQIKENTKDTVEILKRTNDLLEKIKDKENE